MLSSFRLFIDQTNTKASIIDYHITGIAQFYSCKYCVYKMA